MGNKIQLVVDEDEFIAHIRRICRKNLRDPRIKICGSCPIRKSVLAKCRELKIDVRKRGG